MGKVVLIEAARTERAISVEAAWQAYLVAREKADQTRNIEDGITAGKAWRAWLELFDRRTA